jgi:hypothetical protein
MSQFLRKVSGRWYICAILFLGPAIIFPALVQPAAEKIVQHGAGAPKILDEYVMTWTPEDARQLYLAIGPEGREAIRHFYLHLDFWFPVFSLMLFYISLLSLAYPARSPLAWLNLLPIPMWLLDEAENINHFTMAGSYPNWPDGSLTVGPWFTLWKWALIFAIPVIAALGFILKGVGRRGAVPG